MYTTLPTYTYTHAFTTNVPSPLSSSPLRNPSSSPLSPRDANLLARNADEMMSSPTDGKRALRSSTASSSSKAKSRKESPPTKNTLPSPPPSRSRPSTGRDSAFSKRVTRSNPLIHRNADETREARRKLFLKKVREGSEEKRWSTRGLGGNEGEEELLRAIWVKEERRREEERRLEARLLGLEEDVEGEGIEGGGEEMEMVDEVALMEERELEALVGGLGDEGMDGIGWEGHAEARNQQQDTPYGSDDEEYDHIFMDVIEEENRMASQEQQHIPGYLDMDHEMMDMS